MPAGPASICPLLGKLPKPWQEAPLMRGGHLTGGQMVEVPLHSCHTRGLDLRPRSSSLLADKGIGSSQGKDGENWPALSLKSL